MKGVYIGQKPLNILSCAVEGRPGRSAYDTAAAGGYSGTAEENEACVGRLPADLSRINANLVRVNAILDGLNNSIATLEYSLTSLTARVEALEAQT